MQCFKAELYDFPMNSHTSCSANETSEFPDTYGNSQKTTASSFHEERAFIIYATRILGTFSGNQQQYLTLKTRTYSSTAIIDLCNVALLSCLGAASICRDFTKKPLSRSDSSSSAPMHHSRDDTRSWQGSRRSVD